MTPDQLDFSVSGSTPENKLEPIRLVVWDLDETFWKGTISEGEIEYNYSAHAAVIVLAQAGIVSSICSKNDYETVKAVLVERGIWDYFIFPSISWEPKGQRVKSIIDAVQLRPETVMLIDDNPMNLNEAQHYVPGLQVSNETIVPRLAFHPLFKGKEDYGLSRLGQYKILEKKKADEVAAGSDNKQFLKASDIRVEIISDITPHLDRVVELINRTNQLNFTKKRLPEDRARAALISQIQDTQHGLVSVADRYGDYGIVGFFAIRNGELLHYCFSCRTLGMNIETWLYDYLGQPTLTVAGEVLTDILSPHDEVTWIALGKHGERAEAAPKIGSALLRGGCELQELAPYLEAFTETVTGEFFRMQNGLPVRIDHSSFLRYSLTGASPELIAAASDIGYSPSDFTSQVGRLNSDYIVFSFWSNSNHALYQHKKLGFEIPFTVGGIDNALNVLEMPLEHLHSKIDDQIGRDALAALRRDYSRLGVMPAPQFIEEINLALDSIPGKTAVFFLLQNETWTNKAGENFVMHHHAWANRAVSAAADGRDNVHLLRMPDFMTSDAESSDGVHFERQVFHRVSEHIAGVLGVKGASV